MKKNLILSIVITTIATTVLISKAHTVRNCKVIQEHDKVVTVLHPNGERYDFYAQNSNKFIEDTIIRVSFNELKFNKEDFEVNIANPNPIFY